MTDAKKQAEEIADLKKEVEALKAKVSPPKSDFVPMSDAEHRDWVHQMQERRMSMATPPSVIRDWNVLDTATCQDLWRHGTVQSPSMAGASGQVTRTSSNPGLPGSNTTGWVDARPLGPPPGIRYVDQQLDAQDAKDRADRIAQEARLKGKP
jgi:hypothetical protein